MWCKTVIGAAILVLGAFGAADKARAQSSEEQVLRALELALQLDGSAGVADQAAILRQINRHLLAILGDHPTSALAQGLTRPGLTQPSPVLDLVRQRFVALERRASEQEDVGTGDVCTDQTVILDLAERILAQRGDLAGFAPPRFGTLAAYIWLHYRDPPVDEALVRLAGIGAGERRPPRGLEDMRAAYAVSRLGIDAGFQAVELDPVDAIARSSPVVWRAVVLADEGAGFFDLVEQVRADASRAATFDPVFADGMTVAAALADLDDEAKRRIAGQAEARGALSMAALLLVSRTDLSDYRAFVARHIDDSRIAGLRPDIYGLAQQHQVMPLKPEPGQTFNPLQRSLYDVFRAGLMIGDVDFLNILVNQTGWDREIAGPASVLLVEIDSGRRLRMGSVEDNWTDLYDGIAARVGLSRLQQAMAGFSISRRARHYAGSAQQVADWMFAVRAVRPYLTGQSGALPARPRQISAGFDWVAWSRMAGRVRDGDVPRGADPDAAQMLAEMLFQAGQVDDAIAFAQTGLPLAARLSFYRDIMKRLDRSCEGVTMSWGQSILLGSTVGYYFAPG